MYSMALAENTAEILSSFGESYQDYEWDDDDFANGMSDIDNQLVDGGTMTFATKTHNRSGQSGEGNYKMRGSNGHLTAIPLKNAP